MFFRIDSMKSNNTERYNGYIYDNKSVRDYIEKNEFVKAIRKKLMEDRLKNRFPKKEQYQLD
jgi:hypothetical protein